MMRHAGIVLAAGASSRMGFPKALLPTADGVPLAMRQIQLLKDSGCFKTILVLGSEAERIRKALPPCESAVNPDWPSGRFGSVIAGLRTVAEADGVLILPVDTVGVRCSTLQLLL